MKNFLKSVLATVVGLNLFFLLLAAALFATLLGLAALSRHQQTSTPVPDGAYLVFNLSTNIQDAPVPPNDLEQVLAALGGDDRRPLQLRTCTRALAAAATDPRIKGVLLRGSLQPENYGSGFAALSEVRAALAAFRRSGKPVQAWLRDATLRDFYLASVADDIALDPYGALWLPGLAAQPVFFTGAMEKFGIGVQVVRVGQYKSAVEPFILREMSPESRAQTRLLLDDLWGHLRDGITQARRLAPDALQELADSEGLIRADLALARGLTTRTAYWDEILDDLKKATGRTGPHQTFKQVSLPAYAATLPDDSSSPLSAPAAAAASGELAIVYAEGMILDGHGPDKKAIYGDPLAAQLRELRLNDEVKAVVLRINSPGGSASAAETIQREIRLLRAKKPLVVSMGTVAASGGYWIAAPADRIFAEPTTITGSIGVFGLLFNFQELATGKLGLTFDTVKTGRFADALAPTRPKTTEELALVQRHVDWLYEEFIQKVSAGRHLQPDAVRAIAGGHVWSGLAALKLGLVDELGGLSDAIHDAAQRAQLGGQFTIQEYPHAPNMLEELVKNIAGNDQDQSALPKALGTLSSDLRTAWRTLHQLNDPRGAHALLPLDLSLR